MWSNSECLIFQKIAFHARLFFWGEGSEKEKKKKKKRKINHEERIFLLHCTLYYNKIKSTTSISLFSKLRET
jgi:hypothetical protein